MEGSHGDLQIDFDPTFFMINSKWCQGEYEGHFAIPLSKRCNFFSIIFFIKVDIFE